jgi:hypothetical protein
MLHRVRDLLVHQRAQLINAIRGHLAEFGVIEAHPDGLKQLARLDGWPSVGRRPGEVRPSSASRLSASFITFLLEKNRAGRVNCTPLCSRSPDQSQAAQRLAGPARARRSMPQAALQHGSRIPLRTAAALFTCGY